MILLQELVWGKVSQGLMGTNGIIHMFPLAERPIQLCYVEAAVGQLYSSMSLVIHSTRREQRDSRLHLRALSCYSGIVSPYTCCRSGFNPLFCWCVH